MMTLSIGCSLFKRTELRQAKQQLGSFFVSGRTIATAAIRGLTQQDKSSIFYTKSIIFDFV